MNIQAVRRAVMDMYPNATWHRKVHHMKDHQVYAIYRSSQERKKRVDQILQETAGITVFPLNELPDEPSTQTYHQIDIWEYLNDK